MASVKVTSEDFAYKVRELLDDAVGNMYTKLEPIFRKTANETRKTLRSTSPKRPGGGSYARGWQYELKMNSRIGGGSLTLYNAQPGLTHLLENGHAIRNGTGRTYGRTAAQPHIEQANEEAQKMFEEYLDQVLGNF